MASSTHPSLIVIKLAAATLWVWVVVGIVFALRWNSIERPGPSMRTLFPYGEMRIGVDASYPPFATADDNGLYGLDIDIGTILADRLGIPVRFVNMGYDGLYDSLKADLVDVLISALLIDYSRTDEVIYSTPYFNAGLNLITNNLSSIERPENLAGRSLAYEFGSEANLTADQWLRKIPAFHVKPYEVPAFALDAVRMGQSDAALVDSTSARLYLRQYPNWSARIISVNDALYALAVRYDRESMMGALNRELKKLMNDGTLETLISKWL